MTGWQEGFGPAPAHPATELDPARVEGLLDELTARLHDNYPFFHPRYAGQMLKPPHPAAVAAHLAAMLVNPNNHALDGGPATAAMEREAVAVLAAMLHLPDDGLGHLTSSGTIANLEALFVARELHPGRGVAAGTDAHYTHARMCHLLGIACEQVPADAAGRVDLDALEALLRTGRIGTVVLTAGTTGLGAVDPVDEALVLARAHGARVHVDAAYGGFFAILAWAGDPLVPSAPLRAIAECDSVVVDPHKHGLQPYGCGAVLFRDPSVARLYTHDSPYTYYTAAVGHLGEISLECSRAGAAAAALWLTLQAFPLTPSGLGAGLAAGLRAARRWHALLDASEVLAPCHRPELDIVTLAPRSARTLSALDETCQVMLRRGMTEPDPVFLSTLRVDAPRLLAALPGLSGDAPSARVLRSVLMKPAHELWVERLHARVEELAVSPR
ncbi:MAG TPA: aminotransferase class I/II-fold pyridoxal phosphate-dependent enzyme [Candidatus Dormibacteraeota bacterium]